MVACTGSSPDSWAVAPAVTAPTERVAPAGTTYTRLFINVGERDGARKGDFVGAITGEALPLLAHVPSLLPEDLGDASFRRDHRVALAYVVGEMANGIASEALVAGGVFSMVPPVEITLVSDPSGRDDPML